MMLRILGRYVLGPAATVGGLAALGVFDTSSFSAGSEGGAQGVLSSLSGPLEVAETIAVAGAAQMGMSKEEVREMFATLENADFDVSGDLADGIGGAPAPGAASARPPSSGSANIAKHSGSFKTVRPPEPEPQPVN